MPFGSISGVLDSDRGEAVRSAVHRVTQDTERRRCENQEKRSDARIPFHRRVRVKELCDEERPVGFPETNTFTAYTQDISHSGIALLHTRPVSSHRLLVNFFLLDGESVSLVVDVAWSRTQDESWYKSGGRLVDVL